MTKPKCQSTSHNRTDEYEQRGETLFFFPRACYGPLWQCEKCQRMVCCTDGTDTGDKEQDGLCDACWGKKYGKEPPCHGDAHIWEGDEFPKPGDLCACGRRKFPNPPFIKAQP